MRLRPLKADATFIVWGPPRRWWILPKGTRVAVLDRRNDHQAPPSPVTKEPNELYVSAPDVDGKIWQGWLAISTKLGDEEPHHVGRAEDEATWRLAPCGRRKLRQSAWDELRSAIVTAKPIEGYDKRGEPIHGWTALSWISFYGLKRPSLASVIRELGGAVPRTTDVYARGQRALRCIMNKEITMSSIKKSRKASANAIAKQNAAAEEKAAAKASRKATKQAKKDAKPKRSMARTTGETLVDVCSSAKIKPFPTAVAMAADKDVTKSELVKLRDAVNAAAEKCRENKKNSAASAFSAANRLVRRLVRSR